jgi:7,8-dihydropterin-6-yl-methyl-4-(beta-D-ribofuranosyl)aminobenzene 5'-phosphate synthase
MRLLVICTVLCISLASASVLAAGPDGITIRVLYDNCAHDATLQTDWGFSCLITGTEKTILFDTGAKGEVILQNMAKMNVTPDTAEVAVISHNHDDHTGGLLSVLDKNRKMIVYLPPSCPQTLVQQTERLGAKVVTVTKPVEVCKGVYVIGPTGDEIVEQALVVDTEKGFGRHHRLLPSWRDRDRQASQETIGT